MKRLILEGMLSVYNFQYFYLSIFFIAVSAMALRKRGQEKPNIVFILTENLWSTSFGNPRCEAVQDKEWKYIRYYRNDNISAKVQVQLARQLGIDKTKLLYGVHDHGIALYRSFVEGPINGEKPVYEELYHLSVDKNEIANLASEPEYSSKLNEMRAVWSDMIKEARGIGEPKVLRYTLDSKVEAMKVVPAE